MPLTEASKSKVRLASLSATTAAAAESLWSKSRKSSKRRQKSTPENPPEVSSNNPSVNPSSNQNQPPPSLLQQPQDRQEFRRKFLEGLQFYCENSSLILNSDLPADLIEFVTSHGFSVESLGIILELKKSSSAFSAYVDKKPAGESSNSVIGVTLPTTDRDRDREARDQNFSEVSRRLLQHWMSADSCTEAFVSLSLGEEIPGLIAECTSFQRILFAVPDNFRLNGEDFLSFLLGQLLLAVHTLVYGLNNQTRESESSNEDVEPTTIRTRVLAIFLDRIIMRYFSDGEHFHKSIADRTAKNPFEDFVIGLAKLCSDDVIGKRLVSKIFLHLGSHSASKLAKVTFASRKTESKSVASTIFWPAFEFLERNSQWKFILQTLPIKTSTKSKIFWINWAEYIEKSGCFTEIWHKNVQHWIILNKSNLVDEHSLYSTSLAITALAKQIKDKVIDGADKELLSQFIFSLEPGKVLQNIVHSLESINEEKRACGMALGQIVADLQFSLIISTDESKSKEGAPAPKKLKFDCSSKMFIDIVSFYESGIEDWDTTVPTARKEDYADSSHQIEVLDSDDDDDNSTEKEEEYQDDFPILGENTAPSPEMAVDPRILTLRARKRKIPKYFSEIVETLLEKSKNEDEAEILQCIAVLKIPVLLFAGVKIDSKMATTISRCLADLEDGSCLEVPILLGLYELFMQHPFEVADVLGGVTFDGDHYALGQRLMNLTRLAKIVQLSSKQSCYNCFLDLLSKHRKEICGIYPEFVEKYLNSRLKLRICQDCRSTGRVTAGDDDVKSSDLKPMEEENEPLTWRQIVDRRVAAKTRYFVTPRSKTVVTVPDEFSTKLLPILWASIANRLTSKTAFYLDRNKRSQSGNMHDMFLVKIFQYLVRCVLGTSGPNCPHIRSVSSHAGELVSNFSTHEDAVVRRAVLSLLGVTLSVGEGKVFVLEALSSQGNMLETVDKLANAEQDMENRRFLSQIQQCLASYTTTGLLKDLSLD